MEFLKVHKYLLRMDRMHEVTLPTFDWIGSLEDILSENHCTVRTTNNIKTKTMVETFKNIWIFNPVLLSLNSFSLWKILWVFLPLFPLSSLALDFSGVLLSRKTKYQTEENNCHYNLYIGVVN